jgi:hypothetical protein
MTFLASREFTAVLRGPSAVIFQQDTNLPLQITTGGISVLVVCASRWIKRSERVTMPGDLWIEVKGQGENLEESMPVLANTAITIVPFLALSANAAIGDLNIEIAFESTPGISEREFFQSYLPPEPTAPYFFRRINIAATLAVLSATEVHPEKERILRAANQYRLALDSWKLGSESMSTAHLWMAVEALTKARLRTEIAARKLATAEELAEDFGVEIKALDGKIRRDLILAGDLECYEKGRRASDGLEHGFLEYDKMRKLSAEVRDRLANYVRVAVFEMAGLDPETKRILISDPYDKPMGHFPMVKYLKGHLLGHGDVLAAKGNVYPTFRWNPTITETQVGADGKLEMRVTDNLTCELAEGISFRPARHEVWKP